MSFRTVLKSISVAIAFAGSVSASGLEWSDPDYGDPLDFLNEHDLTYASDFNLLISSPVPYTVGTHIESAMATFSFADDIWNDGYNNNETYYYEKVSIYLNNTLVWGPEDVDGTHQSAPDNYHRVEIALAQEFIDILEATGKLDYKVQLSLDGPHDWKYDTYLKRAELVAKGSTATVPDAGSTVAMMGIALVGAAAFRRMR